MDSPSQNLPTNETQELYPYPASTSPKPTDLSTPTPVAPRSQGYISPMPAIPAAGLMVEAPPQQPSSAPGMSPGSDDDDAVRALWPVSAYEHALWRWCLTHEHGLATLHAMLEKLSACRLLSISLRPSLLAPLSLVSQLGSLRATWTTLPYS